jgi:CheY-like chemotaxis protein
MSAVVLIAEDEPMIRRILAEKLTREGHVIRRVADLAGLDAGLDSCDVALVDVTLDGDGVDAMRRLAVRGVRPRAGWFAMLESRAAGDADRAAGAGAAGIILKPFKPTAVALQVATLLAAAATL